MQAWTSIIRPGQIISVIRYQRAVRVLNSETRGSTVIFIPTQIESISGEDRSMWIFAGFGEVYSMSLLPNIWISIYQQGKGILFHFEASSKRWLACFNVLQNQDNEDTPKTELDFDEQIHPSAY